MRLDTVLPSQIERELGAAIEYLRHAFKKSTLDVSTFDELGASRDVVFAHFPQIGCTGLWIDRASLRVTWLSSSTTIATYLWAHEHGARIGDDNVLVFEVRDPVKAYAMLGRVMRGRDLREIERMFGAPFALTLDWPMFDSMLDVLRSTLDVDSPLRVAFNPSIVPDASWASGGASTPILAPFNR